MGSRGGSPTLEARLRRARLVPVIREGDADRAQTLAIRLLRAGLDTIELTTSIPGWQEVAAAVRDAAPDVCLGVGTVLSGELASEAVRVRPDFCVSPCLVPQARDILEAAGIPLIEGGLTPTEVLAAASRGIAKLFPAHLGGVGYLRSLLAVAPDARIIPTGGIPLDEAGAWLEAGALAVGVGSDLSAPGDIGARVRRAVAPVISVACVGECMLELRHEDEHTLRLGFAGDTYNTAVYLRRAADRLGLNVDVGYFTGLGADEYSAAMRAAWRDEGISDRAVVVPGRVPGLYTIRTDMDGERRFTYWRDKSAARSALAEPGFWDALAGDLVHLSGITLQLVPPAAQGALVTALRRVRAAGGRVSFDTNFRPAGWPSPADASRAFAAVCAEADIVLASVADEQLLHGCETPETAVRRLLALGPAEAVLRAGRNGAYVATGETILHAPAERVDEVVDTTAAGDAASGAYLAARLAGDAPLDACMLANSVGAAVIQHPGALIPRDCRRRRDDA